MERYEGFMPKGIKAARAERLLTANATSRRASRVFAAVFVLSLAALIAFFVFSIANNTLGAYSDVFVPFLLVYATLSVLGFIVFGVLRRLYGGNTRTERVTGILNSYVRGILADTYGAYASALADSKDGKTKKKRAHSYVASYTVSEQERESLLAKGALRAEGEVIRKRYEDYLIFLLSDDPELPRYLVMSENMVKVAEKWRRLHLSKYADPQKAVIEENIARILRQATDERERFLAEYGTREYMLLLRDATLYRDPASPKAPYRPLPNREQYEHITDIVKKIRKFNAREMTFSLNGRKLEDFKLYIDAYEDLVSRFAMVGCPTVDVKACRAKLASAKADTESCWFCHTKFNLRFRGVCPRCNHYVCPKCGRCYCNKHIMHNVSRTIEED